MLPTAWVAVEHKILYRTLTNIRQEIYMSSDQIHYSTIKNSSDTIPFWNHHKKYDTVWYEGNLVRNGNRMSCFMVGEYVWLTWAPSLNLRIHSMVLIVMTTGSEPSLVQGTWMRSSWIWPLINVKGSFNSCEHVKTYRYEQQRTMHLRNSFLKNPTVITNKIRSLAFIIHM